MFNIGGISNLLKQAQYMQDEIQRIQAEVAKLKIIGESGAGLVKITINGSYNCFQVNLDSSLLVEKDKKILEDLIMAAFNDAVSKINVIKKRKITDISNDIPLPPGFNMLL